MMIIIVYAILLAIYSVCPFLLQVAGFVLNVIYPDPIPFLDEFIMIMCMLNRLSKIGSILGGLLGFFAGIFEFIIKHWIQILLVLCIVGGVAAAIVILKEKGMLSFDVLKVWERTANDSVGLLLNMDKFSELC